MRSMRSNWWRRGGGGGAGACDEPEGRLPAAAMAAAQVEAMRA